MPGGVGGRGGSAGRQMAVRWSRQRPGMGRGQHASVRVASWTSRSRNASIYAFKRMSVEAGDLLCISMRRAGFVGLSA